MCLSFSQLPLHGCSCILFFTDHCLLQFLFSYSVCNFRADLYEIKQYNQRIKLDGIFGYLCMIESLILVFPHSGYTTKETS